MYFSFSLFLYLPACISLAKEKQIGTSYWQRLIRVLIITTFIYSPGPGIYFNSLFIMIFSFLSANSPDRAITHQKNIQSKRHLWFMVIMEFSYLAGFSPVKIIFTSNIYSVCWESRQCFSWYCLWVKSVLEPSGPSRRSLSRFPLHEATRSVEEYLARFPKDTVDSQVESTRDLLLRKNLLTMSRRCPLNSRPDNDFLNQF